MKLTEKGMEIFRKWESVYFAELEKLRKENNDPDFCEGWCIIDDADHIDTIEDEIGLLIFGYDDHVIDHLKEYIEDYGDDEYFCGFTAQEIIDTIIGNGYIA